MTLIPRAKGVIQESIPNLFSNTIYRMIYWSKKNGILKSEPHLYEGL